MIVAAAVTVNGDIYALPTPAPHHTILHWLSQQGLIPPVRDLEQGFIDDHKGFVGRIQARNIVLHQGQPLAPKPDGTPRHAPDHPSCLFSEDLW